MNTAVQDIEEIQTILQRRYPNVKVDGDIGKVTLSAIALLDEAGDAESIAEITEIPVSGHRVKASFFANSKDVEAFRKCKNLGGSDNTCFKVGDNGVGKWGHDTSDPAYPMAALPREVWGAANKTGGARIAVTYHGHRVEGILGDTMPSLANIHNGCGIDLNSGFAEGFGISDPNNTTLDEVYWEWI